MCVFEPQPILADVRFFAAMKLEVAQALLPVKQSWPGPVPMVLIGMAMAHGLIFDVSD
jgi:hypothetical protein